jgi:hypothetical protein
VPAVLKAGLVLKSPLLSPGDRMGREEFLERWRRLPGLKFAELIDCSVYMPSPLSQTHAKRDSLLHAWLFHYAERAGGCELLPNATWLMGRNSAPQPDLSLRRLQRFGSRSRVGEDDLMAGAPELAVEVCLSSRSYDLGPKRLLYQSAGVMEYLAAIVEDERLEWRALDGGRYRLMKPHRDGTLRSQVFPGLWLDAGAYWRSDWPAMLATLERGIAAAEAK